MSAALVYRLSERVTAVQPNKFELVINFRPPGRSAQECPAQLLACFEEGIE